MEASFQNAGWRRLWVAASLSVALHSLIMVFVPRQPGGGEQLLRQAHAAPPLSARLAAAVNDVVLPVATPVVTATTQTTAVRSALLAASPATAATPASDAPDGSGATTYYFKTSELDRRPFPLTRIEVPPPDLATAESGSVLIKLRISERGRVEEAKIMMGTGVAEFETAALREFSQARFQPGYRGNLPVRSEMLIEVTLRPPSGDPHSRAGLAPVKD